MPLILHPVSKSDCQTPLGQKRPIRSIAFLPICWNCYLKQLIMLHSFIPRIKYITQSLYHSLHQLEIFARITDSELYFTLNIGIIVFPPFFSLLNCLERGKQTGRENLLQVKMSLSVPYNKSCLLGKIVLIFHFYTLPFVRCLNTSSAVWVVFDFLVPIAMFLEIT